MKDKAQVNRLDYEQRAWNQGISTVLGVDEVGRGCLAGPVVAAAVSFHPDHKPHPLITDSKKLSSIRRDELCEWIYKNAADISVAAMSVDTIDRLNILEATKLAMIQALSYHQNADLVLIDGRDKPVCDYRIQMIIKGDQLSYSIAAASIVAKVVRDQMMEDLHWDFPVYDWKSNKGYGTKKHRSAILKFGPTKYHRKLFLRKILANMA